MKKMKKVFVIIVAVCALFCTVGCSVKDYFNQIDSVLDGYVSSENVQTSSDGEESSESFPETESGGELEDSSPTLSTPENVLELLASGLTLRDMTELRFDSCTSETGSIRFYVDVESSLYTTVSEDDNLRLGLAMIPLSYCDQVNVNGHTYMDWIIEFEKAGVVPSIVYADDVIAQLDANTYRYVCYLHSVPVSTFINRPMAAFPFLLSVDEDGNKTYRYGVYESGNYRTNARSLAYVAAESLSAYALGIQSYTADEIELCKTYVNWSVDKANGLSEPTDDNSTYSVTVSPTAITLNVGETATLNVSVAEISHVSVLYKSLDENVATVSGNGKIRGIATGTTIVAAYVAGVPYTVRITIK